MKRTLILIALSSLQIIQAQPLGIYQHGTVVRMRTNDCLPTPHGFMANFGAPQSAVISDTCPEYTLVSDKVVYIIVGRSSNQLIPLADDLEFRIQKSELDVRLDDAKHESKFTIKEMILRSEWEQIRKHIIEQLDASPHSADITPTRNRN